MEAVRWRNLLNDGSLYYPEDRLSDMSAPAPGAFARRIQSIPVLKNKSAVQALGRFHDKPHGRPDALAYMFQVVKHLSHGKM
jgi:hypothetical protein